MTDYLPGLEPPTTPAPPPVLKDAWLSPDGLYRYALTRYWGPPVAAIHGTERFHLPPVTRDMACWVMLNPSTADAHLDDPTIRRCISFTRRWGLAGLVVVNVFAYRATNPTQLEHVADATGPDNDRHIGHVLDRAGLVIAAWGDSWPRDRLPRVRAIATVATLNNAQCLGVTKTGQPRHPLYVSGDTPPVPFALARSAQPPR